jgi:TPR repeat protein
MSVSRGHVDSQIYLSNFLANGTFGATDCEKALHYSELSCKGSSDPVQQNLYGLCLEYCDCNSELYAEYYQRSADSGYSEGQCNYGRCLEEGIGVAENPEEAFVYYWLAADQGSSEGEYHYGRCHEFGIGVEKDLSVASEYYLADKNG